MVIEQDDTSKEMILAYLNAGDFVGEMGLFENKHAALGFAPEQNAKSAEISYSKFIELGQQHPEFLLAICNQMAQRLRDTTRKVSDLAFLDVTGRVARALLDLC